MEIKQGGIIDFFYRLARRYFADDISSAAAALAYYMIFSFFPMIVGLSMILGFADIDIGAVTSVLAKFMPTDIIGIVDMYLSYVAENKSVNIMAVSLFFTFYFPMRAVNYIMVGIDRAYGERKKRLLPIRILLVVLFSIIILFTIFASLILLSVGRSLLEFISYINIFIPVRFIDMWVYLRFVIMAAICSITVTALYFIAPSRKMKFTKALPGAVAAVSCWLIVSAGFSFYVENIGNYSVLFGSIGAIIVLLLWLYITAVILLMGAEVNRVLEDMRIEELCRNMQ
jgi:membrane protein